MENNNSLEKGEAKVLLLYLLKQFKRVCQEASITYYASGGTCLGAIRHQGIIPWDDDIDVMMPRKYYDTFVKACSRLLPETMAIRTRENDPYFCGEYIKLCYIDDDTKYSEMSIDVFFLDDTNPQRKIFRAIQNRLLLDLYFIKTYKVSKMGKSKPYVPRNLFRRFQVVLFSILPISFIDRIHKHIMTAERADTEYWVNWGACYSYKKATYNKAALGIPSERPFENTTISVAEQPEEILTHLYGPNYMTPPPPEKRINHGIKPFKCTSLDIEKIKQEIGEI